MLVSQGSLTWGLRATRAASLKTAPSDRFLFLFIANSFVKKNKAFVQEYRDRGWEILPRGRWIP